MAYPIKILIADDHELFVQGLKLLLFEKQEFSIEATARNGSELFTILDSLSADVILLDINMPGMNGLDVLQLLRNANSKIKVIILSTYRENHLVERAKSLGANGYLLKTVNSDKLIDVIEQVFSGEDYFVLPSANPSVFNNSSNFLNEGISLTKRELELLKYIKADYTNAKIAEMLNLSIYTIETHRKNIMQKLGLKTRTALMKFIIANNI